MHVTFFGAAREVTGSMHLVANSTDRILLDCGLFQGRRKESEAKNRTIPFDPRIVTNAVLSHAHIDHSGRIPLLVKDGFRGRVFCTRPTADACRYLLLDSAHIQESDAKYLNYKTVRSFLYGMSASKRKGTITNREARRIKKLLKKDGHEIDGEAIDGFIKRYHLHGVRPLYTKEEAERSAGFLEGIPYGEKVTVGRDMTLAFYDAGHILGSAFTILSWRRGPRRTSRICFTGDVGRFGKPIIRDPTLRFPGRTRTIDLLIMESTYGDRRHEPVRSLKKRLKAVLKETRGRGGSVIIPSFAFGRTQELLYVLHRLYDEGDVPRCPVYVDSPLAINLTRVFGEHPEVYDKKAHRDFLANGENPFAFRQIRFVSTVEESMALMREKNPHVVIAGSGMCEAGRIVHHLRYKIHDPRNTILVVGYMAENTLGRRLAERGLEYAASGRRGPPPELKFLGKKYPLAARVVELGGFSAHADRDELLRFVRESNLRFRKIAVVHGEEDQALALAGRLEREGRNVVVPRRGETVQV